MPQLIKNGAQVADTWTLVREIAITATLPGGRAIVPLAYWAATRPLLLERGDVGAWLGPADDPESLLEDLDQIPLIAIDFPQFTDGRGYSSARLLRDRYGFTGELRAIGDVLRDQLYYLHQCGFDAFALAEGRDAAAALASLADFHDGYQSTSRRVPYFQRRYARASDAPAPQPVAEG